jgi:serine/threonine protein kinase
MFIVCFFYNQVQDNHLRRAFKTLYVNFNEEYNYRVGRFNSAYNQQQMEYIQIASNQFRDGYKGRDISFEELEFQKQIGQGATCTVHMALYRNKIVAVRQLIMSQISRYSATNFVSEMCLLSKLSHPNIICLYGVVQFNSTKRSHLSMVLEYASEGSVYDYLRAHESVDWQGYKR